MTHNLQNHSTLFPHNKSLRNIVFETDINHAKSISVEEREDMMKELPNISI